MEAGRPLQRLRSVVALLVLAGAVGRPAPAHAQARVQSDRAMWCFWRVRPHLVPSSSPCRLPLLSQPSCSRSQHASLYPAETSVIMPHNAQAAHPASVCTDTEWLAPAERRPDLRRHRRSGCPGVSTCSVLSDPRPACLWDRHWLRSAQDLLPCSAQLLTVSACTSHGAHRRTKAFTAGPCEFDYVRSTCQPHGKP